MIIEPFPSRDAIVELTFFLFLVLIVIHEVITSSDTDANVKAVAATIGMVLLPLVAIASIAWGLPKAWRKLRKRDKVIVLAILIALAVGTTVLAVLSYMYLSHFYQEAMKKPR